MQALQKVKRLLEWNQEYRDSDKKLLLAYWEGEGFVLSETQKSKFMNCTTAETITRARRALKAQYPASEAVDNARFKKYQQHRFQTNWWARG